MHFIQPRNVFYSFEKKQTNKNRLRCTFNLFHIKSDNRVASEKAVESLSSSRVAISRILR